MVKLTANQQSFIELMKKSDEHARRGFELLLKRNHLDDFFDSLNKAGLFLPLQNPKPIPAGEPGYVQIPFWDALNYLEAVAKLASEKNDLLLAEKVMIVVRTVSRAREPDGSIRDNYHTYWKFAEILGLVPTTAVTIEDIDLVPGWLSSKFEQGMIGRALDQGALRHFLASNSPEDWDKASLILRHCTAIRWVDKKELGDKYKKPVTVVEDYCLQKLIKHNAGTLGAKIGKQAAEVFLDRVREVYKFEGDSHWKRPAIEEEHPQNRRWDGVYNRFVDGLRDVLLSWIDHDLANAKSFVEARLQDDAEIVRRIAIYVLNQRWLKLQSIYPSILGARLFDDGHLHELYGLLREHFEKMSKDEKAATVNAIRQIPRGTKGTNPSGLLRYIQRNWLSAIAGRGNKPADIWFNELQADLTLGSLREHPDFHSYMKSWSGPGSSRYSVQELLAFAEDGSIVKQLNDFQQIDFWHGSTTRALVDTLEKSIKINPQQFLHLLPDFSKAKSPYQYGIISGFKLLWDAPKGTQSQIDWDSTWEALVAFFASIISDVTFWAECIDSDSVSDLTPTRDQIPPLIAAFLHSGTQNDETAYPESLLPRTWLLLCRLLEHLKSESESREDAMGQAINSSKGKAIEALFSHALRECRVSDRASGAHVEVWVRMKPVFDKELAQCKDANFEFSTLAGAYLPNLDYLNRDWLLTSVDQIFNQQFPANFTCALEGLAFAPATHSIYALLVDKGIVDWALQNAPEGRRSHERLIERIALAYLQGGDELDSSRFLYLFETGKGEDLEVVSRLFWSVRSEELTPDEIERVFCFWAKCVEWSTAAELPAKLLSSLSALSCYINSVGDKEATLLRAVAPHVQVNSHADDFIEELNRLVDNNPAVISAVFKIVLDANKFDHDNQDGLKLLIKKLAEHGMRDEARDYTEKLRNIQGMSEVFEQLKREA